MILDTKISELVQIVSADTTTFIPVVTGLNPPVNRKISVDNLIKDYSGSAGINISDKIISIDENIVATKSDLNDYSLASHNHNDLYQSILESGINIKTINDQSILGSGNIVITGTTSGKTEETDPIYTSEKPTLALKTDLNGYSLSGHNHNGVYAPILGSDDNYVTDAEKVKLSNLSGINTGDETKTSLKALLDTEYSLTGHTHDDRYYTETETNNLLATKSDTGHTHDDRYFTETEINNLLLGKSDTGHTHNQYSLTGHNHNDLYYTESESDTRFSQTGHTHQYLPLTGGTVSGNVTVAGNLIVTGSTYETHIEKLYTKNDYIILRDEAVGGLAEGAYTGIEAVKYDGINNGRLAFDKDGIARVGDVGSEQPLATREETPIDNGIAIWNSGALKFVTSGLTLNQISLTGHNHNSLYQPIMGSDDNYVTDAEKIKLSNLSGTNTGDETASTIKTKLGITTLSGSNTGDETVSSIKTKLGIITLSGSNTGDETVSSIKTKLGITTLSGSNTGDETKTSLKALLDTEYSLTGHTHDDRYYTETETNNLLATKSDTGHTHSGYQTTLESGTNIKTINSQSILGSGDLVVTVTEVDPVFTASPAFGITTDDTDNWNTAFGWGNHAGAGYLTKTVGDVTYSLTGHTHDDRYYTETEADTRFSQTDHTHTGVYAPVLGSDDNYVTDAQLAIINNTSGTNSGDETVITLKAKLDTVYSLTGHTHSYIPTTTPNAVTATTYTFVIGDAYKLVSFGSGSATSVTIPTNDNVAYAIGTQIDCFQAGAGAVTFAGDTGVTVNSLSGNKTINGQYVGVSLVKTDTNTWLLVGNLKA
jgi:hypothetical protein